MYYLINKTMVKIQSFMKDINNNYSDLTKEINEYLVPTYGKQYYNEKPSKSFSKEFIGKVRITLKNIEIICDKILDENINNNFKFIIFINMIKYNISFSTFFNDFIR